MGHIHPVFRGEVMGFSKAEAAQLCRQAGAEVPSDCVDYPEVRKRLEKYGRVKTKSAEGIVFDSALEARAYLILKAWESFNLLFGLEPQPKFTLQEKQPGMRSIVYVGDFRFRIPKTETISDRSFHCMVDTVVDVKGVRTQAFRIKEKLFRAKFPDIDLQIWDKEKVKELEGR
jgi:hypothetical protein